MSRYAEPMSRLIDELKKLPGVGTWQRIFYAEFDGQRSKRVIRKILGIK